MQSTLKYLDDAKVRGLFTTVISGGSSAALYFVSTGIGMSPILSTILTFYIFGSVIAYSLDILFAKQEFLIKAKAELKKKLIFVPYSDLKFRFIWLFKSFFSTTFFKFLVTMIIDTLIGISILASILNTFYSSGIHFRFMEAIVAGLVALGTFILYNNVLRFDWAYKEDSNPTIDLLVLMWASLVILIFSTTYTQVKKPDGKSIEDAGNTGNTGESSVEEETKEQEMEENQEADMHNVIEKPVRMTWLWK